VHALRQVGPFVLAACLAPLITVADGELVDARAFAAAITILLATSVGLLATATVEAPPWLHDTVVLCSFLGFTLTVYSAGGPASGIGAVLIVPVVWMALYGRRRSVLAALAVEMASVLVLASTDPPVLSTTDIRRALTFLAVSTLIALSVSVLVEQLHRSENSAQRSHRVLAEVTAAARAIREGQDARTTVCQAVVSVSGASGALLLEPEGDRHLVVSASAGSLLPRVRIALTDPSVAGLAYRTGTPRFVAETTNDSSINPILVRLTRARSVLVQPFQHGGRVRGVVVATWPRPQRQAEPQLLDAVALLAEEIGSALERADLLTSLRERASTDPLTGLANRRVWRERLPQMMSAGGPLWVGLFDVDHFKAYNDCHGHLAGDLLLQKLAAEWTRLLRSSDLLVRWGGEEFALALPECSLASAHQIVERLRSTLPDGQSVSAGLACWDGTESIESLMSRADEALYKAKAGGRDRSVTQLLADSALPGSRAIASTS
jgi:diguanylate cyclase (GGDEF)-like protein